MISRKLYAERPGWGEDFDYDEGRHLVAYQFGARLASGLRVLDAGCGEGFCTRTLASSASSVVGVDYSAEAIASATSRWKAPNLSFHQFDLSGDAALEGAPFDVVLNFQVIEHLEDDLAFVRRLRALVASGGVVMITTPNRKRSFSNNPCHVREYTSGEFLTLLRPVFAEVEILGTFGNERVESFDRRRRAAVERILRLDPFGLHKMLPEAITHDLFARCGHLVRRMARRGGDGEKLRVGDFEIRSGDLDEAMDLVALCRP